jgi:hypothetical protein
MRAATASQTIRIAMTALAALAIGGCHDTGSGGTQATAPQDPNRLIVCGPGCGGGGSPTPPPPPPPTAPGFSALSISAPKLQLSRTPRSYAFAATLTNAGTKATAASLNLYMIQGASRVLLNGLAVNCGFGSGVLPTGSCQMSGSFTVSEPFPNLPQLAPGLAALEADLSAGGKAAARTIALTLIPGFEGGQIPTELSLAGLPQNLTQEIRNSGPTPISGLSYQLKVTQGSTARTLGTALVQCPGEVPGLLLPHLSCEATTLVSINASNPGVGMFVAGPATAQEIYMQGSTLLETSTSSVIIRDVRFTSASVGPSSPVIEGPPQPYTLTLRNNGTQVPNPDIFYTIVQGADTAQIPAISFGPKCAESTDPSVLPTGVCTIHGTYVVPKTRNNGSLSPGAARIIFSIERSKIASYDTVSAPITLLPASVTP